MVGLNHEFARELLWREYPTDQRGSIFRQFWDASSYVNRDHLSPTQLAEKIRDIKPIHTWGKTKLGKHNNRDEQGDETQIVLVIRGDLLKRYPNTVIYAQRAKWGSDPAYPYQLVMWDETGEISEEDSDKENIQYPLYSAKVRPDIHFIGFDLTLDEVRGADGLKQDKNSKDTIDPKKLGWYFVIKERPGEVRFGMDATSPTSSPSPKKWDNMSWDLLPAATKVINVGASTPNPGGTNTDNIQWGTNSADMAYILYQKPVLVAVHAMDMLKNLTAKK